MTRRAEIEVAVDGCHRRATITVRDGILVSWPFDELSSRACAGWRVRVSDGQVWTPFSAWCHFETGLLEATDWIASFISPTAIGGLHEPAPTLFSSLNLDRGVASARLYASALGCYDFSINSTPVTTDVLNPGWTSYQHRVCAQTYDVTDLLIPGENRIAATLGNGWYRGQLVWPGNRSTYGSRLALIAQLEVTYSDGEMVTLSTDPTWQAKPSGIVFNDLYDGEVQDHRLPEGGTAASGPFSAVEVLRSPLPALVPAEAPPVRRTGELPAQRVWRSPRGRLLVDFGQNLVGWVRLSGLNLSEGAEVSVRHAEVLEDGELASRPLRSAKATCRYLAAGTAEEIFEPRFTFHGFRYAEISGIDELPAHSATAVIIGSDLTRTGRFHCSDTLLNQLHENVVWSARGNFLSIPTDCPQRDERLGWTGDIQAFAPAGARLFDTRAFLSSWLRDLALEQHDDGAVPYIVPDALRDANPVAAGWGDAAVLVPWAQYLAYGDRGILARQFESMTAWLRAVVARTDASGLWADGFQFGDWLDPSAPEEDPGAVRADRWVVANSYYIHSADVVAEAARTLDRGSEAEVYAALAERLRAAYVSAYVSPDGAIQSDCQTVYALALVWDLLPPGPMRAGAARRLRSLVREADFRVATGFLGTPHILDALSAAGDPAAALSMLLQRECPSWLYAVDMGATTVWERWDSMLPDGSINPGSMTSFNHYAYGSVADWMHRWIGGLTPLQPGYREVLIRPLLDCRIRHARVSHLSPYGLIDVRWVLGDHDITLDVQLPHGVEAIVSIGADPESRLGTGEHRLTRPLAKPILTR